AVLLRRAARRGRRRGGQRRRARAGLHRRGAAGLDPRLAAAEPAADPAARRPVLVLPRQRPGRRQPGHAVRQVEGQAGLQGGPEGHLRRRRRRERGRRGAPRDQGVPLRARQVPGRGREDPQGRAALRPARHRQDAAGPRRRRRGRGAVLLDLGLRLRRDVRRRRRLAGARPVRAGQEQRPGDHLRRRDRRRGPPPRCRHGRRPRRARADPEPAAGRDGRVRRQDQRHPHRGHQPARHPRPGAAAPGPLRPADRRRPARPQGPRGDPGGARQGQADGPGHRPGHRRAAHPRLLRRRPGQRAQRGRAARGAHRPDGDQRHRAGRGHRPGARRAAEAHPRDEREGAQDH
ncbi:MAG: Cell division protein FtsH, partial [uncultured Sphingomonadaceae bacterium]